jgi:hypothetical protein
MERRKHQHQHRHHGTPTIEPTTSEDQDATEASSALIHRGDLADPRDIDH